MRSRAIPRTHALPPPLLCNLSTSTVVHRAAGRLGLELPGFRSVKPLASAFRPLPPSWFMTCLRVLVFSRSIA